MHDRLVAQGLREDDRPHLSEEAARFYRDFRWMAQRTVALGGMGGACVSIVVPWEAVNSWAVGAGESPEFARELFYFLRDHREAIENELLAPKK